MKLRNGKKITDPYYSKNERIGKKDLSREEEKFREKEVQLDKNVSHKVPTHDTCQPPIPFPKALERGALNSWIIEKNS